MSIQHNLENTVRNILTADKFDTKHLIYAERQLDEGWGLHDVAFAVMRRYRVDPNYASAVVVKSMAETALREFNCSVID